MGSCFAWVCVSVNVFSFSAVSYTFTLFQVSAIGICAILERISCNKKNCRIYLDSVHSRVGYYSLLCRFNISFLQICMIFVFGILFNYMFVQVREKKHYLYDSQSVLFLSIQIRDIII